MEDELLLGVIALDHQRIALGCGLNFPKADFLEVRTGIARGLESHLLEVGANVICSQEITSSPGPTAL